MIIILLFTVITLAFFLGLESYLNYRDSRGLYKKSEERLVVKGLIKGGILTSTEMVKLKNVSTEDLESFCNRQGDTYVNAMRDIVKWVLTKRFEFAEKKMAKLHLDDMPLYINDPDVYCARIAKKRLREAK